MRKSKSINILKNKGFMACLLYLVNKNNNIFCTIIRNILFFYYINIYVRFALKQRQYKKFMQLRQKFLENYKNIIILDLVFYKNFIKKHIEWIESGLFQEKYNATAKCCGKNIFTPPPMDSDLIYSHFNNQERIQNELKSMNYPPLLNPDDVDYNQIDPKIAWELNLPLPNNYKFIWLSNGASGAEATMVFLKHCGVNFTPFWYKEYEKYTLDYDMLLKNKTSYNVLCINARLIDDKYINLLNKKSIIFHVLGDPISRLKTGLNHINNDKSDDEVTNEIKHFTLRSQIDSLIPRTYHHHENDTGYIDAKFISDYLIYSYTGFCDILNKLQNHMEGIYCIDTDSINAKNAFNTFCNLAKIFNFPNKPIDRHLFCQRINMHRGLYFLPTNLYLVSNNKDLKITISVYKYMKKYDIDIAKIILDENEIDGMQIVFLISQNDYEILKSDLVLLESTKKFLQDYFSLLKANSVKIKNTLISEKQILSYFKENNATRIALQKFLNDEIYYCKKYYPQFVLKWKYYLELETYEK